MTAPRKSRLDMNNSSLGILRFASCGCVGGVAETGAFGNDFFCLDIFYGSCFEFLLACLSISELCVITI